MAEHSPKIILSLSKDSKVDVDILLTDDYNCNFPTRQYTVQTIALLAFYCGDKLGAVLLNKVRNLEDKDLSKDIIEIWQGLSNLASNLSNAAQQSPEQSSTEEDNDELLDTPIISAMELLNDNDEE